MQPIWKDYFVNLGTSEYEDYSVQVGGETIYTGRAYRRPNEASILVRLNDITADYLDELLPDSGGVIHFDLARTFDVLVGGSTAESVDFYFDWSYDYDFDPDTMPLAAPIGYLDPRQWLILSALSFGSTNAVLTFADGTTQTIPLTISSTGAFSPAFSPAYDAVSPDGPGAVALDLSLYPGVVKVQIDGVTYEVRETCARYSIFYVNAYGGWDSMVIPGAKKSTDLTRHIYETEYDNSNPANRGKWDYAVELSPSWELTTDWLTDAQSELMHHLLNSPFVYLYDLVDGVFIPVVLTDTQTPVKTHRDGMINYTFNAQLAQQQIRR